MTRATKKNILRFLVGLGSMFAVFLSTSERAIALSIPLLTHPSQSLDRI